MEEKDYVEVWRRKKERKQGSKRSESKSSKKKWRKKKAEGTGPSKTKIQRQTQSCNQKKVEQVKQRKGWQANIEREVGKGQKKDLIRRSNSLPGISSNGSLEDYFGRINRQEHKREASAISAERKERGSLEDRESERKNQEVEAEEEKEI